MTSDLNNIPPAVVLLPPPVVPLKKVRAKWPLYVGITSIVVSALSAVGALFQLGLSMHAASCCASSAQALFGLVPAILFAGAVLLIQRKPAGRTLHLLWAWINLLLMTVYAAALIMLFGLASQRMNISVGMVVAGVSSFVLGIAYPLFLVLFLNRRRAFRGLK